jgi:hypothetical protein
LCSAKFSHQFVSIDEFRFSSLQNNSTLTMFPQKDFIPDR